MLRHGAGWGSRRTEARADLRAIIVAEFSRLTAEQVVARLDAAQIVVLEVITTIAQSDMRFREA